jgi:hypothetical protein
LQTLQCRNLGCLKNIQLKLIHFLRLTMTSFIELPTTLGMTLPILLAQSSEAELSPAQSLLVMIIQIAVYVFIAYCTQKYLTKLNYEKSWLAWIPIANLYAILEAGEQEQPLVWTLLTLIPCIGLISLIKIIPAYITICRRLGKSPAILWTFLLCGLGGLIVPAVLAFT